MGIPFRRPAEYPATGLVAVPKPEPTHPYTEQVAELDHEDAALKALEQERARLQDARSQAIEAAQAQNALLARLNTPEGLLETSDEDIEQHQRRWRELARSQAQAEKAFAAFTFAHPDIVDQRQALDSRREHLDLALDKWKIEEQWFAEVAPMLEAALLKLADWHMRKTVANREQNITLDCGIRFDDTAFGPLTFESIKRAFRFDRCYAGRESDPTLQRQLDLARTHGTFPSRLAVTWR
jgi:type I site-specific restriction endonuclease